MGVEWMRDDSFKISHLILILILDPDLLRLPHMRNHLQMGVDRVLGARVMTLQDGLMQLGAHSGPASAMII